MEKEITTFINLLQSSGHALSELGFSAGASEAEIEDIESETRQTIPAEFKSFLASINGQENEDFYFLPDQVRLFSCEEIVTEWKQEQEYAPDTEEFYNDFEFDDKVRCTIYHKTRIPIAGQEGFGVICIDNDPGPNGKVGQIIYLINECEFIVLADSFKELIILYIRSMEKGILKIEKEQEGYPNKLRLKSGAKYMDGAAFIKAFQLK